MLNNVLDIFILSSQSSKDKLFSHDYHLQLSKSQKYLKS